jgi:hypothetical protein
MAMKAQHRTGWPTSLGLSNIRALVAEIGLAPSLPMTRLYLAMVYLALALLALGAAAGASAQEPSAVTGPRSLLVNVSLVPPLSVNAPFGYETRNVLALDLLVGNSAGLDGVELSGIGSRNGDVRGVQIAGVGNWVHAGAYGGAGEVRGVQLAGTVNVASALAGLQLAGTVNVASSVRGAQVAGVMNFASDDVTFQAAVVNVSQGTSRAQLGVVNVADDADVSVGLFSWVRQGRHDVALAATEYGALVEADTGGRAVYGVLTGGAAYATRPRRYLLGLGIGWRAAATDGIALDAQATAMEMVDEGAWTERGLFSARALVALRVAGPLSVFAGPTFNAFVDSEPHKIDPVGYGWKASSSVRLWPGAVAGLRLF